MAIVEGAYCGVEDLRHGDIAYPAYLGTKEARVKAAAEEIDIAIGHIYKTPIEIPDTIEPEHRPSFLTLKKINWLIASGRIVLDMAAAGERDNLHAYGHSMLKEGLGMLAALAGGEVKLPGVEVIDQPEGSADDFSGPHIYNEDPESLVESFYKARSPLDPFNWAAPTAYDHPRSLL